MMNKFIKSFVIVILISFGSFHANAEKLGHFIGAWQGNDPNDGGLQTWFISPTDNVGIYQIRIHDTYLRTCNGNRGTFLGNGTMINGDLIAKLEIQCLSDPDNNFIGDPVQNTFIIKRNYPDILETFSEGFQQSTTLIRISK